jgi:hypothetical protein
MKPDNRGKLFLASRATDIETGTCPAYRASESRRQCGRKYPEHELGHRPLKAEHRSMQPKKKGLRRQQVVEASQNPGQIFVDAHRVRRLIPSLEHRKTRRPQLWVVAARTNQTAGTLPCARNVSSTCLSLSETVNPLQAGMPRRHMVADFFHADPCRQKNNVVAFTRWLKTIGLKHLRQTRQDRRNRRRNRIPVGLQVVQVFEFRELDPWPQQPAP